MKTETDLARVVLRTETVVSPWVRLISKEVEFLPGQPREVYHAVSQADYVAILARTRDGRIPIVRQFRPAVEEYTWELPSGLVESEEKPEEACVRELREETGLAPESITSLGWYFPDTGRLQNRLHAYFVEASNPHPEFRPEPGMEIHFLHPKELRSYALSGKFRHQLHLGLFAMAHWMGFDIESPK